MAIKTNGALYSTGYNNYGQLGLNDTANRNSFTLVSSGWNIISYQELPKFGGGSYHSLSVLLNESLYATGYNNYGQLGLGTDGAGTDKDEYEITVESIPVDGVTDNWDYVVLGTHHTMAIKIVENIDTDLDYTDEEPQVWIL